MVILQRMEQTYCKVYLTLFCQCSQLKYFETAGRNGFFFTTLALALHLMRITVRMTHRKLENIQRVLGIARCYESFNDSRAGENFF